MSRGSGWAAKAARGLALLSLGACAPVELSGSPDEASRTWAVAKVRVPTPSGAVRTTMRNLGETPGGVRFPTVVYMHGCDGFWEGTDRRLDMLAAHGLATIAPDGFARPHKPVSCDPRTYRGGLHRGVLGMRQEEAAHALARARELPWVDPDNLFLMGLSEGGITTATLREDGPPVNARVIEGWTCHAGWPEYRGLNASEGQPVLSLVATADPWFRDRVLRGQCGVFMRDRRATGSRSVTVSEGRLKYEHELLENRRMQNIVMEFLKENLKPNPEWCAWASRHGKRSPPC